MKFKSLLLSLMFLPAVLFGATNAFDNITVRLSEIGRGDLVWTNGVDGTVTNYFGGNRIFSRKTDSHFFDFTSTNQTSSGFMTAVGVAGSQGFAFVGGGGQTRIDWDEVNGFINIMNGNYTMHPNNFNIAAGVTTTFSGLVGMSSNVTMGSFAGNTTTVNGRTFNIPNALQIDSVLFLTNNTAGFNTNNTTVATEGFVFQGVGTTQVPVVIRGALGMSSAAFSIRNSANTVQFQISSNGNVNVLGGSASATITAVGITFINAGGQASAANNTAAANSSILISGGTDVSAFVQLSNGGFTFANGGWRLKRVLTGTNYTLRNQDNYLANRPTSGSVITNFLPAASLSITNGYQYIIYDAGVALVTNIVIFPSGANTINGAASKTISVTGSRVTLVYDGANWEATSALP